MNINQTNNKVNSTLIPSSTLPASTVSASHSVTSELAHYFANRLAITCKSWTSLKTRINEIEFLPVSCFIGLVKNQLRKQPNFVQHFKLENLLDSLNIEEKNY
jgi:hypothetical protein